MDDKKLQFTIPTIIKAFQFDDLLKQEDERESFVEQSPEEMVFESVRSTDENFIGIVNNKP